MAILTFVVELAAGCDTGLDGLPLPNLSPSLFLKIKGFCTIGSKLLQTRYLQARSRKQRVIGRVCTFEFASHKDLGLSKSQIGPLAPSSPIG